MKLKKTMRWFGPHDTVTLQHLKSANLDGIVTALHQIPVGDIWTVAAIQERKKLLEEAGLPWLVVESLPVHEEIKQHRGDFKRHIEHYKISIENLAACGIKIITYNFMPILDWIRTDHFHTNDNDTKTLVYNHSAFIYFDIEVLKRPGAKSEYTEKELSDALAYGKALSDEERQQLSRYILTALPGSKDDFTPQLLLDLLEDYKHVGSTELRNNLIYFLKEVIPVAERAGVYMTIHPDDPPFPLMGLPRIMSTEQDANQIFTAVPSGSNGLCYCTGSFGANASNDLLKILDRYNDRIHFVHLRNVTRSGSKEFRESGHLEGNVPMKEVIAKLLKINEARNILLPMRPDHGLLYPEDNQTNYYPGYSFTGRLKGLEQLRQLEEELIESNE
ncbi:mannonate dehydratase [Fulvivirga lutimaris]|uniref:mannonate dehydratase n=1 Tax=Fulvivirga lutimaris TaxID=1819566 RepID=UPI0012BD3F87|nr:mannonate dehydratase [Fulvivirga lutimaris]